MLKALAPADGQTPALPEPRPGPLRDVVRWERFSAPELSDRYRRLAEWLRRGELSEEGLARARDLIIELALITPGRCQDLRCVALGLHELLSRRDSESAGELAIELERTEITLQHVYLLAGERHPLEQIRSLLSDEEIAHLAGVKIETVRRWEKEPSPTARFYVLLPLARAFRWLRRLGMGREQARAWLFELPHPALAAPPLAERQVNYRYLDELAFAEALQAAGVAESALARRRSWMPDTAAVGRLERLARLLSQKAPEGKELERVCRQVLELVARVEDVHPGRTLFCLGDLLRRRDGKASGTLGAELRRACLAAERRRLPTDRRRCLELVGSCMGLSAAQIADLVGVKEATVSRWQRSRDEKKASPALRHLAHTAHWLARAGMSREEASGWLFERDTSLSPARSPAETFCRFRRLIGTVPERAFQEALAAMGLEGPPSFP